MTEEFDRQERMYSIEMRKRYSKDDFESLAVIGKGAFGEVSSAAGVDGAPARRAPAQFSKHVSLFWWTPVRGAPTWRGCRA